MATKKAPYVLKAVPTRIVATSRAAVKIRDNYYTFEATEERTIPRDVVESSEPIDIDIEWKALFEEVNDVIDTQCEEIIMQFKNSPKK